MIATVSTASLAGSPTAQPSTTASTCWRTQAMFGVIRASSSVG